MSGDEVMRQLAESISLKALCEDEDAQAMIEIAEMEVVCTDLYGLEKAVRLRQRFEDYLVLIRESREREEAFLRRKRARQLCYEVLAAAHPRLAQQFGDGQSGDCEPPTPGAR